MRLWNRLRALKTKRWNDRRRFGGGRQYRCFERRSQETVVRYLQCNKENGVRYVALAAWVSETITEALRGSQYRSVAEESGRRASTTEAAKTGEGSGGTVNVMG